MAKIVEKYELENGLQELSQMHSEITSLSGGQNSKQRLRLVKAYVKQIEKYASNS